MKTIVWNKKEILVHEHEPHDFQEKVRTSAWSSALIVYEKYKRKMDLRHEHLVMLRDYVESFSRIRKSNGKKAGKDLLTQEASAYVKKNF
jgi:hypothetical protein